MPVPIIQSLLDTDLYKLTMMQCVYHQFPKVRARYRFECRNKLPTAWIHDALVEQIQWMSQLCFNDDELHFLAEQSYFKKDFIHFLKGVQLKTEHIQLKIDGDQLHLVIDGPWLETILWEVPLLAVISELCAGEALDESSALRLLFQEKIQILKALPESDFKIIDFGTRRRFSKAWHYEMLTKWLQQAPNRLEGTSNIWLAKELKLPVFGTMAHEFLQACQILAPDLRSSQSFALETWLNEYRGQLAIALTDTITLDVFLKEFNEPLSRAYSGLRQDSGDPFEWTEKVLKHYRSYGIPSHEKVCVYSDRLTIKKAYALYTTFRSQVQTCFGIGTHLTHDTGNQTCDIVIKLIRIDGKSVVKISDSPGKVTCDDALTLSTFKDFFGI